MPQEIREKTDTSLMQIAQENQAGEKTMYASYESICQWALASFDLVESIGRNDRNPAHFNPVPLCTLPVASFSRGSNSCNHPLFHLKLLGFSHNGSWLSAFPTTQYLIPDTSFRPAILRRLELPVFARETLDIYGNHAVTCRVGFHTATRKHNILLDLLCDKFILGVLSSAGSAIFSW